MIRFRISTQICFRILFCLFFSFCAVFNFDFDTLRIIMRNKCLGKASVRRLLSDISMRASHEISKF